MDEKNIKYQKTIKKKNNMMQWLIIGYSPWVAILIFIICKKIAKKAIREDYKESIETDKDWRKLEIEIYEELIEIYEKNDKIMKDFFEK